MSRLFWAGLILLIIGTGPLLCVGAFSSDPNPNPVGLGMLAGITFWPALGLLIVGWNKSRPRR